MHVLWLVEDGVISEEEINAIKENSVPQNKKDATKFDVTLLKGKIWSLSFLKLVNPVKFLRKLITYLDESNQNDCNWICAMLSLLIEWFQQQNEFTTEFESMEVLQMNKCLWKSYVSVRRKDTNFTKKKQTSLLSVQAALDRNLKTLPLRKKFSLCDNL